jgi:serine/threonine protein kinase
MDPALATGTSTASVVFQDGLGERRRVTDATGTETLERLCLRAELTAIPSFEFALRERASRLAGFRHTYYARVRSVDRLNDAASTLAVVSESIRGVRLSTLLAKADRPTIDINAAVHLIRQLVSAVSVLHETARDIAHGAIGPERIVITPNARVIIVEHVLGAAIEQLHYSRDRYWSELRIALPPSPTGSTARFDQRSDVTQVGVVSLSLILGRLLTDQEYPTRIADVLSSAWANSSTGELEPMPPGLRAWIGRALQLDPRNSFASALEARNELEKVLSGDEEEVAEIDTSDIQSIEDDEPVASAQPHLAPPAPLVAAPKLEPRPEPKLEARIEPKPQPRQEPRTEYAFEPAQHVRPEPKVELKPEPARERKLELKPEPKPEPKQESRHEPRLEPKPEPRPEPRHEFRFGPHEAPVVDEPELEIEAPRRSLPMAAIAAAAVVVLALGGFAARKFLFAPATVAATGTFSVSTNPVGAQVFVDGQSRGVTPLTLALNPGPHSVELRADGGEPRTMPITIAAGQQISQYVELPRSVAAFGQLQIRTEPAGAQVTIDGAVKGKAPLLIDALTPGEHAIVLESDIATVKQTVNIEAGQTASLVVPIAPAEGALVSGWVSVQAPVELQLFENKKMLGTTLSDRIMVSAGRHEIEIVNETLGYRVVRTVQVPPGKVAPIAMNWPTGSIAVNAMPWAEVWVEGQRMGETPIGNLTLPIGPHEIVFRHPELGEQRQAVTVTLKAPARVSVDLRKKQ